MRHIHRNPAGELMISEMPVASLAEQFGTPLYVYSGDGFAAYYHAFCDALVGLDTAVHYAVKAKFFSRYSWAFSRRGCRC